MEDKRVKNGFLLVVCLAFPILLMGCVMKSLSNHNPFLLDRFMGQLFSPIVPAALPQSRPARSIPMMSTLRQINMKEKIPKRKCSTVSARHLAQVCRLTMVLTDKNFVVCMYQYFSCCDKPPFENQF
jgi:hypothetical protein